MKNNRTGKIVLTHIILWLSYLLILAAYRNMVFGYTIQFFFVEFLKVVPIILALTYTTLYLIIPNQEKFKKKWYMLILAYALIIIATPIQGYILYGTFFSPYLLTVFLENAFVVNVAASLVIMDKWVKTLSEKRKINQQKNKAELHNLESKISPHFLFNALNNVYSMVLKHENEKSATALEELSELLRKILYDNDSSFIALGKEIELIKNYINLQKIRFEDTIEVKPDFNCDHLSIMIPTMVLFGFVENSFKHVGNLPGTPMKIDILLQQKDHLLTFKTTNSISDQHKSSLAGGFGTKNTENRLKLIYDKGYDLKTSKNENSFTLELTLDTSKDVENELYNY